MKLRARFNTPFAKSVWTTNFHLAHVSPDIRESKTVLDSGFHAVDFGFQELDSRFLISRDWIPYDADL